MFDFKIGDLTVIEDIDIFAKVGKNRAYDEFIEFEIKNKREKQIKWFLKIIIEKN